MEDGKDILGTPFFFDVFRSTEQGRATDCLSKRCQSLLSQFGRQGNESARQIRPVPLTPHFFTHYPHTPHFSLTRSYLLCPHLLCPRPPSLPTFTNSSQLASLVSGWKRVSQKKPAAGVLCEKRQLRADSAEGLKEQGRATDWDKGQRAQGL